MKSLLGAVSAIALLSVASVAQAADINVQRPATAVAASPWNPWQVRVRALGVIPQEDASLNVPGSVNISNSIVPELDITYYFTKNLAAELILGVTPHNVKGAGALAGIPVGRAWLLPPTLTFQYHFTNFGAFKPYVGAGVNYTVFFNEKAKGPFTSFNLKNAPGVALQVGFDYMINQHWGVNVDIKKLWLNPDVAINGGAVRGDVNIDPWIIGAGVTYKF